MSLFLTNTLTRKKEAFRPLRENQVGMYVCGPTVYGPPHLGHAKSYLTFDILAKHLRQRNYSVRYVQNITDVGHLTDDADAGEDKIQKQARLDRVHPYEIVDKYMLQYFDDMRALKIAHPSFYVRATQHIGEQIAMIETLVAKGHAYAVDGNVYFDVRSFPQYGKLSGRTLDEQREAVRVEARSDKKSPQDFALWKKAEPEHILKWNSPWGPGYPGWHIECSVMSQQYLGDTVDIHGGGLENMFPHHECEIAQSECCTGKPFVNFWVHNNMVTVDGVKMGKSLGNFKTIQDLLSRHAPETIRMFLLSTHYRSPTNYTEEAIQASATGLKRLSAAVDLLAQAAKSGGAKSEADDREFAEICRKADQDIGAALDDDLNTPGAIAGVFSLVTDVNRFAAENRLSAQAAAQAEAVLQRWGEGVLGIVGKPATDAGGVDLEPIMQIIVDLRKEMKASKRFDLSDRIRDQLKHSGIVLEDTKDGTRWKKL
jgi:cysteinyl-tRNA synthetase